MSGSVGSTMGLSHRRNPGGAADLPRIRWHSTERVFCDFGNVAVTNDDY